MANVLAWRHVSYEDLDGLEPGLRAQGYDITYWDALYGGDVPDSLEPDILIVLGAPIGVYETTDYPFISRQISEIRRRLDAGKPVLGICFGAQLLAAAAGSRVYKGQTFEFGWEPIKLTETGLSSPVAALSGTVFHCHGDTFDLPAGAKCLASSELYENQAFSLGPHLGVQFHVEVTARGLSRWEIGHVARIKSTIGLQRWREQTSAHARNHENTLARFTHQWINEACGLQLGTLANGRKT